MDTYSLSEWLCSLVSFATNNDCRISLDQSEYLPGCPFGTAIASGLSRIDVITDMIRTYGAEFEGLVLTGIPDGPNLPALGEAIRASGTITAISVSGETVEIPVPKPGIARMISAAAGGMVRNMHIGDVVFSKGEAAVFAEALNQAQDLTKISFLACLIDAAAFEIICVGLCRLPRLELLELSRMQIDYKTFANNFPPHLTTLKICWLESGLTGVSLLSPVIAKRGPQLKSLSIQFSQLGDAEVAIMADGILARAGKGPTALRELDLSLCGLRRCVHVFRLVERSPNLEKLNMYGNEIGKIGGRILGTSLAAPARWLRELNLSGCMIGSEGTAAICSSLSRRGTALRSLRLSENHIGSAGVIAIAQQLLPDPSKIECLSLADNGIDVAGARALAKGLTRNSSLRKLNVSYNRLDAESAMEVINGLLHLPMKRLCMGAIGIFGIQTAEALANFIVSHSESLELLRAGYNKLDGDCVKAILGAVTKSHSMRKLYLNHNGPIEAGLVAEVVVKCRSLRILNIWGAELGDEGAKVLADAMIQCGKERDLNVCLKESDCGSEKGKEELAAVRKRLGIWGPRTVINYC